MKPVFVIFAYTVLLILAAQFGYSLSGPDVILASSSEVTREAEHIRQIERIHAEALGRAIAPSPQPFQQQPLPGNGMVWSSASFVNGQQK